MVLWLSVRLFAQARKEYLPFYTYVYQKNLSDQLQMNVNAANGNLLLHATPEQIHGTGLTVALDSSFNSQY